MIRNLIIVILLLYFHVITLVVGWSPALRQSATPRNRSPANKCSVIGKTKATIRLLPTRKGSQTSPLDAAAFTSAATKLNGRDLDEERKRKRLKILLQEQGGLFSFQTKYGALSPYAIYNGFLGIFLGLFWYIGLIACQILKLVSRERLDKRKRIPTFIGHLWGVLFLRGSMGNPKIENLDILKSFYIESRPAMFVANHASWQDILFLGYTIGWRNYKFIAKKELLKVPILSKSMSVGDNIILDRTSRREQIQALKKGIDYLKAGVNLCVFPEGTRSRSGRLIKFKRGAFKIASKAGAPIIPIALVGTKKVYPSNWIFPCRSGRKFAKVVVCHPVETKGREENAIEKEVREALIAALPEDQRPLRKEK